MKPISSRKGMAKSLSEVAEYFGDPLKGKVAMPPILILQNHKSYTSLGQYLADFNDYSHFAAFFMLFLMKLMFVIKDL